jgi:6,7-dimethyl-8-ribityllumazine synthase
MAGHLPKHKQDFLKIPGAKIAIISSSWHWDIVGEMIKTCVAEVELLDIASVEIHKLPGSLELPLTAKLLFESKPDLNAIIAFGVVLKGGTTHNDTVLQQVNQGFSLVSDKYSKPIINEVIGVDDIKDAQTRAVSKGIEAAYAVSEFLHWKKSSIGNY